MELAVQQIATQPSFPLYSFNDIIKDINESDKLEIEYPESDGKPMGETGIHVLTIIELHQSLTHFFRDQKDVCITADLLFYYKKGVPKCFKVPDVMVIKGIGNYPRRVYKLWEEKVPSVIFEITSKSTVSEDIAKTLLYASLGVPECFLFDPLQEYLEENIIGYRLDGSIYSPILPESDGSVFSQELGLLLKRERHLIRLVEPETGRLIPLFEEESRRAEKESRRAEEESLRAREQARRAEEEKRRAEEEAKKAIRLAAKLREMGIDPESV